MTRRRIIFMGSPDFAIPALDQLHAAHDVVAVYTQPPRKSGRGMAENLVPVAAHARRLGIEVDWPTSLKETEVQAKLAAYDADIFVVVAYGLLLPAAVLALPKLACINGHASLLPRWRGAAPIQRAIEAGDAETGISAMVMERGLDTGPVLATERCPIMADETAGSLHDKLASLNADLLGRVVDQLPELLAQQTPQDDANANYAAKISPAEAEIDWTKPAEQIDRHIRAFAPVPGAWFTGPRGRIKVRKATIDRSAELAGDARPGQFIGCDADGHMQIATGEGVITLETVQPAGKKPMDAAAFLNGQSLPIGAVFGTDDGS